RQNTTPMDTAEPFSPLGTFSNDSFSQPSNVSMRPMTMCVPIFPFKNGAMSSDHQPVVVFPLSHPNSTPSKNLQTPSPCASILPRLNIQLLTTSNNTTPLSSSPAPHPSLLHFPPLSPNSR